uniref:Apolipoprotein N-acyltransferase n=1 Tax=Candidatus Kentrum eta TaxID=2126337 RepID=A0A450UWM5_9GAMM|nr:MAG: apolipoprotein N-acyltransferase [Candidatus Kentron sp. H]VFJ96936.1 MAG: apolipoprotein N-acyltransferase [Candidatus Kentron sp. H]VFK02633.1 MAG: apolipoprotein N-acyltransferase [Candidatus Kentron sp. H]
MVNPEWKSDPHGDPMDADMVAWAKARHAVPILRLQFIIRHSSFVIRHSSFIMRMRPDFGDITALAGGLMMPFAFAPFGLHGLAILGLALLFQALMGASPRRAFRRGWIFGLAMFGMGVFWIHESFKFAAVALPPALLLTGALVMILALYPALFGFFSSLYLWKRKERRPCWAYPPHTGFVLLALPAGWVLTEWVRGRFLSGFPWLEIGYAHVDSPLAGFAPLLGAYGVGWASALSAGLVLSAFRMVAMKGAETVTGKIRGLSVLAMMGCGLWGGAIALGQVTWTTPTGSRLNVALIQGNVSQEVKWLPGQRQATLDRYLSLTQGARARDLVVWPETALPGFYDDFPDFIARLGREAKDHDTHLLLGVALETTGPDAGSRRYFNSVAAITGEGIPPHVAGPHDFPAQHGFYHKRHLVPFGEYLPMASLLRGIVDFLRVPMSDFSPGPPIQVPLMVAGQRIGVSVCYEAAFGRDIIASLPKATLLVNISNDAWFGDSPGPHQNLQMARMRARESGRYLLRGTNTGISAIIDPQGRIIDQAPQFRVWVLTGAVTGMVGATPYVRYGDWVIVLLTLAALIVGYGYSCMLTRD